MGYKRYDQFEEGAYDGSRIILHADPTTGELQKMAMSDIPGSGGGSGTLQILDPPDPEWDCTNQFAKLTPDSNENIILVNVPTPFTGTLHFKQDATGSRLLQINGVPITVDPTPYQVTRITVAFDGEDYSFDSNLLNIATGSTLTQLDTPTDFEAEGVSTSQIDLTWTDVGNETAYYLHGSFNGGVTWQALAALPAGSTSWSHEDLSAGTEVTYRLIAVGDGVIYANSNYAYTEAATDGSELEELIWFIGDALEVQEHGLEKTGGLSFDYTDSTAYALQTIEVGEQLQFRYSPTNGAINGQMWFGVTAESGFPTNTEIYGIYLPGDGTIHKGTLGSTGEIGTLAIGDWLRISRTGGYLFIWQSEDGIEWTQITTVGGTYTPITDPGGTLTAAAALSNKNLIYADMYKQVI